MSAGDPRSGSEAPGAAPVGAAHQETPTGRWPGPSATIDQVAFLAEAGDVLGESLDYRLTLERLANVVVPRLADWCSVDLVDDDGSITNVALAHADPAKMQLASEFLRQYPTDPTALRGVANVARTGRPELYADVSDPLLEESARDSRHLELMKVLELRSVLIVPLSGRGRVLGAMTLVGAESGRRFGTDELLLAEELGRRAGLAIDNARLYQAEQDAARRSEILRRLTAAFAGAMTIEEASHVLLREGIAAVGAIAGLICIVDEASPEARVIDRFGYPVDEDDGWPGFPIDGPLPMSEAIRESRPVFLTDLHGRKGDLPSLGGWLDPEHHSLACLPLIVRGKAVGGAAAVFRGPHEFDDDEKAMMTAIAQQCAQAVERAWLYEAEHTARERAEAAWRRVSLVSRASELLAASLDYEANLIRLAELAVQGFADLCLVDVLGDDGSVRRVAAAHADARWRAETEQLQKEFAPSSRGQHPVARVIRTGRPEFAREMSEEFLRATTRDEEHFRIVRDMGFQSFICVPLPARGRILGTLTLVSTTIGRQFDASDVELAEELARRAAVRIDNARLYSESDHIARTLQQSLLPPALPDVPGFEIAVMYRAAGEGHQVGGDFYDVFETSDGYWAMVVGDVCGKGPEAAAVTGLARHSIRAIAMHQRRPAKVLRTLNEALLRESDGERFCTVCYVRLRPRGEGAQLTVSLGGHLHPLLVRPSGVIERIGISGELLGLFEEVQLKDAGASMGPGDVLILYTDGLLGRREEVGFSQHGVFGGKLQTMAPESAEAIAGWIRDTLAALPPRELTDDVAVVVVKCVGPGPPDTSP